MTLLNETIDKEKMSNSLNDDNNKDTSNSNRINTNNNDKNVKIEKKKFGNSTIERNDKEKIQENLNKKDKVVSKNEEKYLENTNIKEKEKYCDMQKEKSKEINKKEKLEDNEVEINNQLKSFLNKQIKDLQLMKKIKMNNFEVKKIVKVNERVFNKLNSKTNLTKSKIKYQHINGNRSLSNKTVIIDLEKDHKKIKKLNNIFKIPNKTQKNKMYYLVNITENIKVNDSHFETTHKNKNIRGSINIKDNVKNNRNNINSSIPNFKNGKIPSNDTSSNILNVNTSLTTSGNIHISKQYNIIFQLKNETLGNNQLTEKDLLNSQNFLNRSNMNNLNENKNLNSDKIFNNSLYFNNNFTIKQTNQTFKNNATMFKNSNLTISSNIKLLTSSNNSSIYKNNSPQSGKELNISMIMKDNNKDENSSYSIVIYKITFPEEEDLNTISYILGLQRDQNNFAKICYQCLDNSFYLKRLISEIYSIKQDMLTFSNNLVITRQELIVKFSDYINRVNMVKIHLFELTSNLDLLKSASCPNYDENQKNYDSIMKKTNMLIEIIQDSIRKQNLNINFIIIT